MLILSGTQILTGCGGGGGSDGGGGGPATETRHGRVVAGELGGTGLKLDGGHQATPTTISAIGEFSFPAYADAAQIIFVTDNQDHVRALALNIPGASTSLTIGADSTARALLFLAEGLITSDAVAARASMDAISHLASYPPYRDFVASRLPTTPLDQIVAAATFVTLKQACLGELFPTRKISRVTDDFVKFSADFLPSDAIQTERVKLTNADIRHVAIRRQLLDGLGNSIGPLTPLTIPAQDLASLVSNVLPGGKPKPTFAQPGTTTDTVDLTGALYGLTPVSVAAIRYWVLGPGKAVTKPVNVSQAEFDAVTSGGNEAVVASFFMYIAFPLLSIYLGLPVFKLGSFSIVQMQKTLGKVFNFISNSPEYYIFYLHLKDNSVVFDDILNVLNMMLTNSNLVSALVDFIEAYYLAIGLKSPARTILFYVFGRLAIGLVTLVTALDLATTLLRWRVVPSVRAVELPVGSGMVEIQ